MASTRVWRNRLISGFLLWGIAAVMVVGSSAAKAGGQDALVALCHVTGDGGSQEISVAEAAVAAHLAHGDSLGACAPPEEGGEDSGDDSGADKVVICHDTGSGNVTVEAANDSLPAHLAHGDSLGECPADEGGGGGEGGADKVTICHDTGSGNETIEAANASVAAHLGHGDSLGACPDDEGTGGEGGGGDKVTVCHQNGSGGNETIEVANSSLPAHIAHGDGLGACPDDGSGGDSGKTVVCHVDGSGGNETIEVANSSLPAHIAHGDSLGECEDGGEGGEEPTLSLRIVNGDIVLNPRDDDPITFLAELSWSNGTIVPIDSGANVVWSIDDPDGGSWLVNVFTPGHSGNYIITGSLISGLSANYSGLSDSVSLQIKGGGGGGGGGGSSDSSSSDDSSDHNEPGPPADPGNQGNDGGDGSDGGDSGDPGPPADDETENGLFPLAAGAAFLFTSSLAVLGLTLVAKGPPLHIAQFLPEPASSAFAQVIDDATGKIIGQVPLDLVTDPVTGLPQWSWDGSLSQAGGAAHVNILYNPLAAGATPSGVVPPLTVVP